MDSAPATSHAGSSITLAVATPGISHRLELTIHRSFVHTRCAVSDIEIAAFAIHDALEPWVAVSGSPRQSRIHVPPGAIELVRAISAFSHQGPVLDLRLGAIAARLVDTTPTEPNIDAALKLSLPDGAQSIGSNQLLSRSIRDHWLAYRAAPHPSSIPGRKQIDLRALPIANLSIAAALASIILEAPVYPDNSIEPEILWYVTRHCLADDAAWPDCPLAIWNAVQHGETTAILKGWIREDPTGSEGFRWRRGPRWDEALPIADRALIDAAGELAIRLASAQHDHVDAACATIADLISPEYARQYRMSENAAHTAHAKIGAAPLLEDLDAIAMRLASHEDIRHDLLVRTSLGTHTSF